MCWNSSARRFNTRDACAQYEYALRVGGFTLGKQLRLGRFKRLELGSHHRVMDARHVLLERKALETHVACDTFSDRRLHLTERLETPVRVRIERASD